MLRIVLFCLLATTLGLAAESGLKFHRLDGQAVTLSELHAKEPLLLVTWCSECPSCRLVERDVEKLAHDYRGKARVVVVDVHAPDTAARVDAFLKRTNIDLDVVLDDTLVPSYNITRTTTALLFDGKGELRYRGCFQKGQSQFARQALAQLIAGVKVEPATRPESGCTFLRRDGKPLEQKCDLP